jgi:hypothetical protein
VSQLLQLEFPSVQHLHHATDGNTNYEKIARHYGWALRQVFDTPNPPPYALVLEDDMDIAPDFFQCARHSALHASFSSLVAGTSRPCTVWRLQIPRYLRFQRGTTMGLQVCGAQLFVYSA